jgi:hypothetical protein
MCAPSIVTRDVIGVGGAGVLRTPRRSSSPTSPRASSVPTPISQRAKGLAREHAEHAPALLDAHAVPASSWSDTGPLRVEIRRGAEKVLEKLDGA